MKTYICISHDSTHRVLAVYIDGRLDHFLCMIFDTNGNTVSECIMYPDCTFEMVYNADDAQKILFDAAKGA